jgi:hypothetical protein
MGGSYEKSNVSKWHKRTKYGRVSKSQMKMMLITLFEIKFIVHFEFIPQGETVNQAYYEETAKKLLHAVIGKGLNF